MDILYYKWILNAQLYLDYFLFILNIIDVMFNILLIKLMNIYVI